MKTGPSSRPGYILVETIVAMGLLSISMMAIQGGIRQGIVTRGQAQDFTTARFLLQRTMADIELQPVLTEDRGRGVFEAPYKRFKYEWEVKKVDVPMPTIPDTMPPEEREKLRKQFQGKMGKIAVIITWTRAGLEFEVIGETLTRPEKLWLPPELDEAFQ